MDKRVMDRPQRKEQSLSWSSVVLAFKTAGKQQEVVERPKALGDIRGFPIFIRSCGDWS